MPKDPIDFFKKNEKYLKVKQRMPMREDHLLLSLMVGEAIEFGMHQISDALKEKGKTK